VLLPARESGGWQQPRQWPLWSTPGGLIGYHLALLALALTLGVVGLVGTPLRLADLAGYAALLAGAAVCVEASRRLGEAAGPARDLQTIWTMPIALALPPIYGLLAPIPLKALSQRRVGRSLVYRRVLSATVIGLAHYAASTLFHALLPGPDVRSSLAAHPVHTVLLAVGCAAACYLINVGLIAVAVQLASPGIGWRQVLGDRETLFIDLVEVCLGVVVFVAWTVTPILALVLLPPAVLLQRCLTFSQLRAAARTDPKTGLLNAVSWQEEASREIVRASRERRPLAVLMVDLDHFKAFNDSYGHIAGDQALVAAAKALEDGLRSYDLVGRFGGEEFTVLLPNADEAEAQRAAERLRRRVADLVLPGTPGARLTASIGGATVESPGVDVTDLLAAADHALYRAKNAGRNQIAFAAALRAARSG
jgi:diguanylate cyclase (GGDEF)-like protein